MSDSVLALKSDPAVLATLRVAAQHKATAAELFEQRVSFVFSAMSEKSGVTREQVRELVSAHEAGRTAAQD